MDVKPHMSCLSKEPALTFRPQLEDTPHLQEALWDTWAPFPSCCPSGHPQPWSPVWALWVHLLPQSPRPHLPPTRPLPTKLTHIMVNLQLLEDERLCLGIQRGWCGPQPAGIYGCWGELPWVGRGGKTSRVHGVVVPQPSP